MDELHIEAIPGPRAGVRILKLSGPFKLDTLFDFQTAMRAGSADLTIIDMSGVPYMDSAALGSILGFHVSCQREKHCYVPTGVSDRLKTILRVSGVDRMVPIRQTIEEAAGEEAAGA